MNEDLLVEALRLVRKDEWAGWRPQAPSYGVMTPVSCCPTCKKTRGEGHAADCARANLLQKAP